MLPLPVSFDFTLPKPHNVPLMTALAAGVGYIYGKMTDTPTLLCAKIFASAQLTNSIFYLILSKAFTENPQGINKDFARCRAISTATTLLTQIIGVLAMRHFNLIAKQGTLIWSGLALGLCLVQLHQVLRDSSMINGRSTITLDLTKIL